MKRLRPVVLIAAIILGVFVVGIIVVIATFDADRYRPLVVEQLHRAVGRPVDVGRLSLRWQGGIAARCDGLTIHADASKAGEPLLRLDSASATVRLLPLLSRRIEIGVVRLAHPRVHVARDAQGRINLMGLLAAGAPAAASGQQASLGSMPVRLNVERIELQDAALHWTDAASPAAEAWASGVDVVVHRISLAPPISCDLRVSRGAVRLAALAPPSAGLAAPIEALQVEAAVTDDGVELRAASATLAGGTLHAVGRIEHLSVQPRTTLKLAVERLSLQRLLPAASPEAPQVQGTLSVTFEGAAHGLTAEHISRTLAGSGRLTLTDGKVANLNVLREVFERLSMLPGLVQALQSRLPEASRRHLQARDTLLQPINVSLTAADGAITLQDVQAVSEAFALRGTARLQLDGTLAAQMTLAVEPGFSSAIIRSVQELQALTDADGRLTLPVVVQGTLPQVSVLPDVGYVASHLLMTKTRDWLGKALEGVLAPPEASPADGSPSSAR